MVNTIKNNLFKDYLRERRDEHIIAVEQNVYDGANTSEEAKQLLTSSKIAYSIYQQYKLSKLIGGVRVGKGLFINNRDLTFVTSNYLHDGIEEVIKEIDLNEVVQHL